MVTVAIFIIHISLFILLHVSIPTFKSEFLTFLTQSYLHTNVCNKYVFDNSLLISYGVQVRFPWKQWEILIQISNVQILSHTNSLLPTLFIMRKFMRPWVMTPKCQKCQKISHVKLFAWLIFQFILQLTIDDWFMWLKKLNWYFYCTKLW